MKLRTIFWILVAIAVAAGLSGSEAEGTQAIGIIIEMLVNAVVGVVMGFVDAIINLGGDAGAAAEGDGS